MTLLQRYLQFATPIDPYAVKYLIERSGFRIDHCNDKGWSTVIYQAHRRGCPDLVIRILIEIGVDISLWTPGIDKW